ncbi:hypothetical protein UXR52_05705 [Staphylococcus aureus]
MYHNSNANFVNGITLNVRDKNELKPFYEDVLGLNIINETFGLAIVDFHYPETTHLNLQGPDGIYYRFNHIEVED